MEKDLVRVEISMRIIRRHIAIQFDNGPNQVNLNYIRHDNIEHTIGIDNLIKTSQTTRFKFEHVMEIKFRKNHTKFPTNNTNTKEKLQQNFRGTSDKLLKLYGF